MADTHVGNGPKVYRFAGKGPGGGDLYIHAANSTEANKIYAFISGGANDRTAAEQGLVPVGGDKVYAPATGGSPTDIEPDTNDGSGDYGSGSSGGGGGPAPVKPPTTPEEIDAFIRTNFPQMAWALNHPEVGPILRQAATEMWSSGRLQGALLNTNWYKTTAQAERNWDAMYASDPAEARKQFDAMVAHVGELAKQLGIPMDMNAWQAGWVLAATAARSGWTDDRIIDELLARAEAGTITAGTLTGTTEALLAKAKGDYFINMSEETAFAWAKNMLGGSADQSGFDSYIKELAKSQWNTMAPMLDQGFTVKQIADPYIQQAASLMEISPSKIDMLDSRWSKMLDFVDPETGERRMMTMAEAATAVRNDPEWRFTRQAVDAAAKMGQDILSLFGKV